MRKLRLDNPREVAAALVRRPPDAEENQQEDRDAQVSVVSLHASVLNAKFLTKMESSKIFWNQLASLEGQKNGGSFSQLLRCSAVEHTYALLLPPRI